MDSVTSGFVTIQNINKFWDYAIPALLFLLAGVLIKVFLNKPIARQSEETDSRLMMGLPLGLTAAYCTYVLGAFFKFPELQLGIFSLALAVLVTIVVMRSKMQVSTTVQLVMALLALNLKILTTQGSLFILVLLNAIALFLVLRDKVNLLLAVVSIIIFKKFDFGPYFINDLFHSSEFVISYQRGLNALGEWHVFPNIGYLEEAIPNLIVDVFSASTLGYVQLSIQDAYSLCLILLTGGMYFFLEKKWKGVAYALTTLFVAERLTLILVVNLGLLLSTLKNNYRTWAALGFAPLLMLGLSPPYGAIFVLAMALFFLRERPNIKFLITTVLLMIACVALFSDTLIYFLKVYKDWGVVNSAAHGTTMWSAPVFKIVLRLTLVFLISMFVWQVFEGKAVDWYGWAALLGIALSLWMYLNYGFTRLDKGTGSRIFPVGLAIFAVLIPYLKRYTKTVPIILFVSFFGASFATPKSIQELDMHRQSPKMTMNDKSQKILEKYQSVAQQFSGDVVLFNDHPVLGNYIANAKVPPFSSPWVAVGQLPQSTIIDFLKANPSLPILLGEDFSTWDSVDVRARSPLVYRFIALHYKQVMMNDVIVAIPADGPKQSELFSGFDVGEAAAYYRKHKDVVEVAVPCEQERVGSELYRVDSKNNYFYARLHCGVNKLPDVYFLGEYQNVTKISTRGSK